MYNSIFTPRPWFQLNLNDPGLDASGRWVCSQLKDLFSWIDTCVVIDETMMCHRYNCTPGQLKEAVSFMVREKFLATQSVDGCTYLFRSQKRFGIFVRQAIKKGIKPPADNYVYLMRDHASGLTKIGRSNNVDVREKTLRAETPSIELIASFEASPKTEKELHRRYAGKRRRGEWFNLSENDVIQIVHHSTDPLPFSDAPPPPGIAIPPTVSAGFWVDEAIAYRKRVYGWYKTANNPKKPVSTRNANRAKCDKAFKWFRAQGCTITEKAGGKVSIKFPKL